MAKEMVGIHQAREGIIAPLDVYLELWSEEIFMKRERSSTFYALLHDLEYKIGNECYNGNIQNYGPGGEWEGEGREFRYPMRFINKDGDIEKYKGRLPYTKNSNGEFAYCVLGEGRYSSAHYAFGANELHILRGIRKALESLESRFNLDFDELLIAEKTRAQNETGKTGE